LAVINQITVKEYSMPMLFMLNTL